MLRSSVFVFECFVFETTICSGHNFECVSSAGEVAVNFCATTKKSSSRDLETVVNLTESFITLSFILLSKRKTKLLAIEQTFYALHSVYHLTCRK